MLNAIHTAHQVDAILFLDVRALLWTTGKRLLAWRRYLRVRVPLLTLPAELSRDIVINVVFLRPISRNAVVGVSTWLHALVAIFAPGLC